MGDFGDLTAYTLSWPREGRDLERYRAGRVLRAVSANARGRLRAPSCLLWCHGDRASPYPCSLLLCRTRSSPAPAQLRAGQAVPPRGGMAGGMPVTRGGWPTAGRAALGPGARPFTSPPRKQEPAPRGKAPETRGPGQGPQTTKSWSQVALVLSPLPPPGHAHWEAAGVALRTQGNKSTGPR